jgi:hypothetical protein
MFTMSGGPVWVLVWGAGLIVFLGAGTALLRAGCSLADVSEPGWGRSLLAFTVAAILCVPLAGFLLTFGARLEANPDSWFGPLRLLALVVSLLLAWAVSAVLYTLVLAAPLKKGLLIAALELVLAALLAALLAAVVLVVLALVQIFNRPAATQKTAQLSSPRAVEVGRPLHRA